MPVMQPLVGKVELHCIVIFGSGKFAEAKEMSETKAVV